MQSFLVPMRTGAGGEVPTPLRGKESVIFGNLQDISNFHRSASAPCNNKLLPAVLVPTCESRPERERLQKKRVGWEICQEIRHIVLVLAI